MEDRVDIKIGAGWTNLTEKSSPNFCDETGSVYLVRCPKCKKENYALAVTSGTCCWCGFDINRFVNNLNSEPNLERSVATKSNSSNAAD
jgi:hypothetical protein